MDPDQALRDLRSTASVLLTAIDRDEPLDETLVDHLITLLGGLDSWLAMGGALPARWTR